MPHTFHRHLLLLQGKPERAPACHNGCLGTLLLQRSAHVLGDTSITCPTCFSLPLEWPACVTALRQRKQLPPEHFTSTVELLCTVSDHSNPILKSRTAVSPPLQKGEKERKKKKYKKAFLMQRGRNQQGPGLMVTKRSKGLPSFQCPGL